MHVKAVQTEHQVPTKRPNIIFANRAAHLTVLATPIFANRAAHLTVLATPRRILIVLLLLDWVLLL